ncbi:DUF3641 domain-containing protein [Aromatoleum bremense]|uniref:DUF3641 domain-containing protein n=1 Tax=Aromatoleum bremense TaxID=76115 RepID=UPI0024543C55|nr:DUF3641 domain-containing protein [Aromatoleum bremense]
MADSADDRQHITSATAAALAGRPMRVADHCYGGTAGQGSSCGGALDEETMAATRRGG